jgi:hypothetical protein
VLRRSSPIEQVLTYATFFAISLAIHMVVILGDRSGPQQAERPTPTATAPGAPR